MKNFFKQIITKLSRRSKPEASVTTGQAGKPVERDMPVQESVTASLPQEKKTRTRRRRPKGKKPRQKDTTISVAGPANEDPWDISKFKVPEVDGKTRFHDFDLPDPLLHAISDLGFSYCTPIQAEILPSALSGKDACGRAQTGTGKTAAFLITIITRILKNPIRKTDRKSGTPRALILAPTRELAIQITEEARQLSKYCDLKIVSIFGGMDYEKQQKQMTGVPVDIIVATPGRLLDFQNRRSISLRKVEILIIDEADRMLDMGFIPDVRKIINSTPAKEKRQTMLFSATLTEAITRLSSNWTCQPVMVEIEPQQIAVTSVDQIVYLVTIHEKFALLFNIIDRQNLERVMVFCNRRDEVDRLAEMLTRHGINASILSGDVPQKTRIRRLDEFKAGKIRVLVATDVAARGIHVEGMDHVINFKLPHDPEDYVHRIGRTGRAGATGTSISFADEEDAFYIPAIEEFIERKLDCIEPDKEWLTLPEAVAVKTRARRNSRPRKKTYDRNTRKPSRKVNR